MAPLSLHPFPKQDKWQGDPLEGDWWSFWEERPPVSVAIVPVTLQISPSHKAGSMSLFSHSVYLAGTQPSRFSQSSCSGRNCLQSTLRATRKPLPRVTEGSVRGSPQGNCVGPWPRAGAGQQLCVQKRVNTMVFLVRFMTYEEQCKEIKA